MDAPVILDTDTLSELGRGNLQVRVHAAAYLSRFGRLTTTAVTAFECRRGFRTALREGRSFQGRLEAFEVLISTADVLPFDEAASDVAARIWAGLSRARRHQLGDILISAIAASRQLAVATRNRRDFEGLSRESGFPVTLVDWTRPTRRGRRDG
jgi:predicted nucleic acid-binding protein